MAEPDPKEQPKFKLKAHEVDTSVVETETFSVKKSTNAPTAPIIPKGMVKPLQTLKKEGGLGTPFEGNRLSRMNLNQQSATSIKKVADNFVVPKKLV